MKNLDGYWDAKESHRHVKEDPLSPCERSALRVIEYHAAIVLGGDPHMWAAKSPQFRQLMKAASVAIAAELEKLEEPLKAEIKAAIAERNRG